MKKIIIYKNPNGDTRTASKDVSYEQFQEANDMHIQDVSNVMSELARHLIINGALHDYTKKSREELFYKNFLSTMNEETDFINDEWYQLHIKEESHHLLSNCHDDITLLDVLEMIVDCVCVGKSRNGEVRELEISNEILKLALDNTLRLIDNITRVK